ncbi:26S proteasome non-ATPase regulatory subunit 9 [Holothuria leucospilota]|uniref:26S proteasome non-ATPase regulatory subunit 9 n=1 Tax=Holothuria leucospilota TaxID=206669 RepID=A0A9Q1BXC9_HOLLE|nr:26S proteasome non-ATPase regulatory subunit 9 [Holothuria leucospilota]
MAATMKEQVSELIAKKDSIEAEIKELYGVLETQKNVGMEEPLVDTEGYPRNDIDVYAVRTARHKIICLQNDHKALMADIEKGLHELHALERTSTTRHTSQQNGTDRQELPATFAKVDLVSKSSPAEKAGLQVGDEFVEFGSVTCSNFKSMRDIGTLVQHSQGQSIRVLVVREHEVKPLSLTPNVWDGRGLLGCNITPLR